SIENEHTGLGPVCFYKVRHLKFIHVVKRIVVDILSIIFQVLVAVVILFEVLRSLRSCLDRLLLLFGDLSQTLSERVFLIFLLKRIKFRKEIVIKRRVFLFDLFFVFGHTISNFYSSFIYQSTQTFATHFTRKRETSKSHPRYCAS